MTWTLGEDLQEISVPYLIIERNQSLAVWHSKVACCQPKPPKLTIYHWIKTELRSATLFKLKDSRISKEQTKKNPQSQAGKHRGTEKMRWPADSFRARNTTVAPQTSPIDNTAFQVTGWKLWQTRLGGSCYQNKTPWRTISVWEMIREIASYQEIIQKNLFGKSLLMKNAEAHHESLTFRKEQYRGFVEAGALQMWFYLKSRSLKTTGSTPRRHTGTSGILKRYRGI